MKFLVGGSEDNIDCIDGSEAGHYLEEQETDGLPKHNETTSAHI